MTLILVAFLALTFGVWLKARQIRSVIERTLIDIDRLEFVDAKVWLANYDLERWESEL